MTRSGSRPASARAGANRSDCVMHQSILPLTRARMPAANKAAAAASVAPCAPPATSWRAPSASPPPGKRLSIASSPNGKVPDERSEEHTSELQSLMRISYAVFCLKKKTHQITILSPIITTYKLMLYLHILIHTHT